MRQASRRRGRTLALGAVSTAVVAAITVAMVGFPSHIWQGVPGEAVGESSTVSPAFGAGAAQRLPGDAQQLPGDRDRSGRPRPNSDPSGLADARRGLSDARSYEEARGPLIALLQAQGSPVALAALDDLVRRQPRIAGVCHALAHDLGHAALERAGGSVGTALSDRDDVCGGGYTHGVIEEALAESNDPAADMLRMCAPAQDGSCFHGIGHGLMFVTGMDVDASLELCDRAPSSRLRGRCGEGVFMQYFSIDVASMHGSGPGTQRPSIDDAHTTCAETRGDYSANCWFYAPTVWLAAHPDDFAGALGWCAGATSALARNVCARGVGSRTVKFHPDDVTIGARVCREAGEFIDECLAGMGSYWSVHWRGEREASSVCPLLGDAMLERRCLTVND